MRHVSLPARLRGFEPLRVAQSLGVRAGFRHGHYLRIPVRRPQGQGKVVATLQRFPELRQEHVIAGCAPVPIRHHDIAGTVENGLIAAVRGRHVVGIPVVFVPGRNAAEDPRRPTVGKLIGAVTVERGKGGVRKEVEQRNVPVEATGQALQLGTAARALVEREQPKRRRNPFGTGPTLLCPHATLGQQVQVVDERIGEPAWNLGRLVQDLLPRNDPVQIQSLAGSQILKDRLKIRPRPFVHMDEGGGFIRGRGSACHPGWGMPGEEDGQLGTGSRFQGKGDAHGQSALFG